jgi:UDP-N-acetylglucosamine:LPS N-acetylglucosamine transferase
MAQKKILMTVLDAGAGHRTPALAVRDAIEAMRPGAYRIDVVDLADASGALSDGRNMRGFWDYCLAHPRAARFFYSALDFFRVLAPLSLPVAFPRSIAKGRRYIGSYAPDIIFSTHYFMTSIAARARDALRLPIKVLGYVTDPFDAFAFWCEKRVDALMVSTEEARDRALSLGFPAEKIEILPFPIHARFYGSVRDRETVLRDLRLDPSLPTLVCSQGGQGIGGLPDRIEEMARRSTPVNVIAVCGKNADAMARLERAAARGAGNSRTRIAPLGYVSTMPELLRAADVLVAKAGASTTFEAAACGLPTIFTSWAIQSERPNMEYLVKAGAGWYAPDEASFWAALGEALDPEERGRRKRAALALGYRSGADAIAARIVAELERPAGTPGMAGRHG